MNNEIKEILDDLDYCKNRKRGNISLKHNECDLLLNYITNLQQKYNDNVTKYEELLEKYSNIQQRIDNAIQYIKCHTFLHNDYGNEYYTMGEYFSPNWCIDILNGNDEGLETLKTFVDYKERVRKAIQYIEEKGRLKYNPDELINILRGDSNENT